MPIPSTFNLVKQNSNFISWGPIIDKVTGAIVTDVSGTATTFDHDGNAVASASALSMTQRVANSGICIADIDASFNPPSGENYRTVIALTSTSLGAIGKWTVRTVVTKG
jgi:hypothetical protein